jgi:hypothetical protein
MTKRPGDHRTALITTGGIIAVIVAGAFAVGANIGILDTSSDHRIGQLAVAGDLVPTTEAGRAATLSPPVFAGRQAYLVADAGTVALDSTGSALVVTATDAQPGWTWVASPSDANHAAVTFSGGGRTLVFSATRAADGSVDVRVDDTTPAATSSASATAPSHDVADEHEEHEEHDEHEGRDDDD